jgi:hypothetical protein
MSNLDKLRAYLGLVGGQQSMVLGLALKRLKEQDGEIERLGDLLALREGLRDDGQPSDRD